MDTHRVTLRDVAAHCGVSTATASKVLSGKENTFISLETRGRIEAAAKSLGYRANFGTRLMQDRPTGLIGIALARERVAEEEHARDLLLHLTGCLRAMGLMSHLALLSDKDPAGDVMDMMNVGCEAFIIFGSPTDPPGVMKALEENRKPYVAFQSARLKRNVESDTARGVKGILENWRERGLVNFKMLLPDTPYLGTGGNRGVGLAAAFPGIPLIELEKRHVRFMTGMEGAKADRAFEISSVATEKILSEEPDTQAIFYYTDQGALGGIRALLGRGLVPGRDMAVAAVNDSSGARFGAFPFTSVGHDTHALAKALLAEMKGRGDLRRLLPPLLNFRGT